jgi:hypothetical protein
MFQDSNARMNNLPSQQASPLTLVPGLPYVTRKEFWVGLSFAQRVSIRAGYILGT